jgi:Sec-independent protein translocase protein TatA
MDPAKLLFIGVAALIILGPERLPQVARKAGELWSLLRSPAAYFAQHLQEVAQAAGIPEELLRQGMSRSLGGLIASAVPEAPAPGSPAQSPRATAPRLPAGAATGDDIVAGPWELT